MTGLKLNYKSTAVRGVGNDHKIESRDQYDYGN
jgi:hypothetical protein